MYKPESFPKVSMLLKGSLYFFHFELHHSAVGVAKNIATRIPITLYGASLNRLRISISFTCYALAPLTSTFLLNLERVSKNWRSIRSTYNFV